MMVPGYDPHHFPLNQALAPGVLHLIADGHFYPPTCPNRPPGRDGAPRHGVPSPSFVPTGQGYVQFPAATTSSKKSSKSPHLNMSSNLDIAPWSPALAHHRCKFQAISPPVLLPDSRSWRSNFDIHQPAVKSCAVKNTSLLVVISFIGHTRAPSTKTCWTVPTSPYFFRYYLVLQFDEAL